MSVLKFSEFLLESQTLLPNEIDRFFDDGYKIKVSPKKDSDGSDRIIVSEENPHSYCLYFMGDDGKERSKIWIPKEAGEFSNSTDASHFSIHGDKKWIAKSKNREALEDFLEDYIEYKTEHEGTSKELIEEVRDDVAMILDVLDLDEEVDSIKEIGENSFELTLKKGGLIEIAKNGRKDLYKELKFYPHQNEVNPSIIIKKGNGASNFGCMSKDYGNRDFTCGLEEVHKNPYYNYVLKNCMGRSTYQDEDSLLKYFIEEAKKGGLKSKVETDEENDSRNFLKDLKSVISTYVPEEKLRSLVSPSPVK